VRFLIEHTTRLAFPAPVREHQCELRLAPRAGEHQRVASCHIEVSPEATLREHVDCFGNRVHRLSLVAPHGSIAATLHAEVETRLRNPFDYAPLAADSEAGWMAGRLREEPALHDFVLHRSPSVPELSPLGAHLELPPAPGRAPLIEAVQGAMAWMAEAFAYDPAASEVHEPLGSFVDRRAGVCQDFAHFLVALVRSWGFAARYVAGYVDPGALPAQATHAWAEVLIPGAGWRGFDATRNLVANDAFIPVAVGRDSRDAAPIRGTFKGDPGVEPPQVELSVRREGQ
jgi:transglutaminase-like putative cysteine protease